MIKTNNLTKKYGEFTAVDCVNLTIQAGEIYGFLGPNGAGKTSTIMMLLGLVPPTTGDISLFGEDYTSTRVDLRKRIGVVPEKHPVGMWSWMTGREYLDFFADIFEVEQKDARIGGLLEKVLLSEFQERRISKYSRGMLQKLSIVRALLHDPDILFLDEPISGLDPIGIKQVRDLILEESRDGRTVFISSHLLSEMEKICNRVGIIHEGKLIAEDFMPVLLDKLVEERTITFELENLPSGLAESLQDLPFVRSASAAGNMLHVVAGKEGEPRKTLSKYLVESGLIPVGIKEESVSLEDAFVAITSENIGLLTPRGGKA